MSTRHAVSDTPRHACRKIWVPCRATLHATLLVPYSALPVRSLSRLYIFRQCLNASASISDDALQVHTDFLILCVGEGGWLRHLKLQLQGRSCVREVEMGTRRPLMVQSAVQVYLAWVYLSSVVLDADDVCTADHIRNLVLSVGLPYRPGSVPSGKQVQRPTGVAGAVCSCSHLHVSACG